MFRSFFTTIFRGSSAVLCAVTIPPADLRSLSLYYYAVCGRMCVSSVHVWCSCLLVICRSPIDKNTSLSITNSVHLLTPNTWRSLSTSSLHTFLSLPLRHVPSSSWVKIFLSILSSSILSRWPSQLILCPFIHFTIFSPLLNASSSRFVLIFHSPSSYLCTMVLSKQSIWYLYTILFRKCYKYYV